MSTAIDIRKIPALARLVEEVETTKKPRAIKRDDRVVAVLSPVLQDKRKAIAETVALAGAWKDLPSDHMEEELDRIRHASKPTPPLDLDL
jgi:hypothetical protein